jgi:hypothetical protein
VSQDSKLGIAFLAPVICPGMAHGQRSVVNGRVDDVKTEYSRDHVTIHESLLKVLLAWAGAPMKVQQELMRQASI